MMCVQKSNLYLSCEYWRDCRLHIRKLRANPKKTQKAAIFCRFRPIYRSIFNHPLRNQSDYSIEQSPQNSRRQKTARLFLPRQTESKSCRDLTSGTIPQMTDS